MSEALTVFTPEWIEAFRAQVQSSPSYRKAAARWEGDITLVIQADATQAIAEDLTLVTIDDSISRYASDRLRIIH